MILPAFLAALLAATVPLGTEAAAAPPPAAGALPADPLDSPMWEYHAQRLFPGAVVRFDDRLRIEVPQIAENQRVFPVTVDARALQHVQRIVLFADLNPIPVALDFTPGQAAPFIATRIKLDQRTPVRAAALTRDGIWHVAGSWIDAAGGGCSAPPISRVKGDWAEHLGEMRGRGWSDGANTRLRFTFRHPMDTGLVENTPAYHIEQLTVKTADGQDMARMRVYGSVAEDPAFTLIVPGGDGPLSIAARDTSGLEFDGEITPLPVARPPDAR